VNVYVIDLTAGIDRSLPVGVRNRPTFFHARRRKARQRLDKFRKERTANAFAKDVDKRVQEEVEKNHHRVLMAALNKCARDAAERKSRAEAYKAKVKRFRARVRAIVAYEEKVHCEEALPEKMPEKAPGPISYWQRPVAEPPCKECGEELKPNFQHWMTYKGKVRCKKTVRKENAPKYT
jgi:hypothetical protein